MTSRQRLLAAMQRKDVDRVPLHVRGVNFWDERWVATRDESYRPLIDAVAEYSDPFIGWSLGGGPLLTAAQEVWVETEVRRGEDWDEHITTLHTPAGALRARHLSSNRGLPGLQVEHYVKDLEDLQKVTAVPFEPLTPKVSGFFELQHQIGERGLVTCDFVNPLAHLHALVGSELLGLWSRTERKAVVHFIGEWTDRLKMLIRSLLDRGVGPVFRTLGHEFAIPPLMSPADFREFCVIPEAPIYEMIHQQGGLVHVHCHGPMDKVLESFLDLRCDCLHPVEPPPMGDIELADAKARIGHRICLEGNFQIGDLYAAPTAQVIEKTRAALQAGGPTGFILCPTASPYTTRLSDLTVRNYLAMIETAVKHC
ncbi:MAG: uroporphyrinogen decarboxylase family protein [Candidatus Zipacnadales bacterium]